MPNQSWTNAARACLLGLAVGDAVGTTAEFRPRGSFARVTDMIGGGPFELEPGEWTDDTSMALCLAESLVECRGFDAGDQMQRYCRWWREGHFSVKGRCFDIGTTVSAALLKFERFGEPFSGSTSPGTAGNGSIMRLAPVPISCGADRERAAKWSRESSRTTHGAAECLDACEVLGVLIHDLSSGASKGGALENLKAMELESPRVQAIAAGSYAGKEEKLIGSSGYVVHTLEAALWSFYRTGNFEDAILCAANLGEDADTTGAVCGQIAGACYGVEGIPGRWLEKLAMRPEIEALADKLALAAFE